MEKRDVIRTVLKGERPPFVPWSMGFTKEVREKLQVHFGCDGIEVPLENHLLKLGSNIGFFDDLGGDRFRDVFGVTWDRSIDKDTGNVDGWVLPEPTLDRYEFPDPLQMSSQKRNSCCAGGWRGATSSHPPTTSKVMYRWRTCWRRSKRYSNSRG